MPTFAVQPAHHRHVRRIANRMREIDRIEAAAMGHSPVQALRHGLKGSTLAWTVLKDGEPIAMMGCAPVNLLDRIGSPWLLGTDEVARSIRALLKLSPPFLAAMRAEFYRLENMVADQNEVSKRYLKRLGFAFGDDLVYVRGVAFRRFFLGGQ